MFEIELEFKWTAGTKPLSWPIIGARHFGVPEDSHPYHDYNPDDGAESMDVTPSLSEPHPPVPITQLAITQYFVPGPCRQRFHFIDLEHGITGFARPATFEF